MREIRFRSWNEKDKDLCYINNKIQSITGYINHKDEVVMQFTGLKDKEGVEIYEGDIVKLKEVIEEHKSVFEDVFPVIFEAPNFRLCDKHKKTGIGFLPLMFHKFADLEVIGNIYENPELLEEK